MARIRIEKVEEGIGRLIRSLDRQVRMVAITRDGKKKAYKVTVAKGAQIESIMLPFEIASGYIQKGEGHREIRRIIGRAISKLTLAAQRRRV